MILRLLLAYVRWVWGVTPAFETPDINNSAWCCVLLFAMLLDIVVLYFVIANILDWLKERERWRRS